MQVNNMSNENCQKKWTNKKYREDIYTINSKGNAKFLIV